MLLDKRRKWALVAGLAGVAGVQLAERAVASSWRLASNKEPPDDPYNDVDWKAALTWAAAVGAAAAVSQLVSRHGAAVAWERVTGKKPPRPRRRRRSRS